MRFVFRGLDNGIGKAKDVEERAIGQFMDRLATVVIGNGGIHDSIHSGSVSAHTPAVWPAKTGRTRRWEKGPHAKGGAGKLAKQSRIATGRKRHARDDSAVPEKGREGGSVVLEAVAERLI